MNVVLGTFGPSLYESAGRSFNFYFYLIIFRGLYSPPPNPSGVRGQSEQSEQSPRTPLGLNSDFFLGERPANLEVLSPRTVLGQS